MRSFLTFLVLITLITGSIFAQDGRIGWHARARSEFQFNFTPNNIPNEDGTEPDNPGVGFLDDNDGLGYSWDNSASILLWYGRDLLSMWAILNYRQGWGFETLWDLNFDPNKVGQMGGAVRIGARLFSQDTEEVRGWNPLIINKLGVYGWFRPNNNVLIEVNPYGGASFERMFPSVWKTPAMFFDDSDLVQKREVGLDTAFLDDSKDVFLRIQFRDLIDNLNFGFALPHFGRLEETLVWTNNRRTGPGEDGKFWDAYDILLRTVFGFKYDDLDFGFAGGFQLHPNQGQRAYLGGEYKILDHMLSLRADFKFNDIGAVSDNGADLDMAQGVLFTEGPWGISLTLRQDNLLYNDNDNFIFGVQTSLRYSFIPRRVMGRMWVNYYMGMGDGNSNYRRLELEPGIFWAIGPHGVTENLEEFTGMFARLNIQTGTQADNLDINSIKLLFGFRWSH